MYKLQHFHSGIFILAFFTLGFLGENKAILIINFVRRVHDFEHALLLTESKEIIASQTANTCSQIYFFPGSIISYCTANTHLTCNLR